jgi:dipeptidyl aminopeptidase/acylaminoacyl peptidase
MHYLPLVRTGSFARIGSGFVLAAIAMLCLIAGAAHAQSAKQAFTVQDLVRLKRVSDPQVSADGRFVAYTLRETDIESNRGRTDLWLLALDRANATPQRLTQNSANDSSPRWAPDSRTLYFLSTRSGSSQVWRLSLDGGESIQVTDYPLDVGTMKVAPNGKSLALSMEVLAECGDLKCTKDKLDARGKSKATGRLHDKLFVRHWDTWKDGTRSNLFVATLSADGKAGAAINVSKSLDADVPSKPMGGDEEYAWSLDSKRLVFSARIAGRTEPWSTNFDLYEVEASGAGTPTNLTADNPAWDTQPVFLANGDLAYLAMERPGFEADRFHAVVRSARTNVNRPLTKKWDRSIGRLGVAANGRQLLATADDIGQHALFSIDAATGKPSRLVGTGQVTEFAPSSQGVVIAWASLAAPADLFMASGGNAPRRLTDVNADTWQTRAMSDFEQFSFKGWNDATVYAYVMKPHGYAPGKKFPIVFIVHGGPQASFQNQWSFRWNAQTFAGAGYGVVFIDFHGSPGYGQAFTDSISQDWGGKPFVDLQKGFAAAVQKYEWLDGSRACSLGASYGGYMQNWIAGQWPDQFRCIVNHAGIFDTRSMYYTTEELWFTEWENGGPYYEKPEIHEKHNPANFVTAWKTPMLVIHGELDYRVPYSQGLATFTALQRRGIESKYLHFPDENHWILKPANSVLWHDTVLDWLKTHLQQN